MRIQDMNTKVGDILRYNGRELRVIKITETKLVCIDFSTEKQVVFNIVK